MKVVLRLVSAAFDPHIWLGHRGSLQMWFARGLYLVTVLGFILLGLGSARALTQAPGMDTRTGPRAYAHLQNVTPSPASWSAKHTRRMTATPHAIVAARQSVVPFAHSTLMHPP